MAILGILTAPHPVLELRARDVEADEFGPELERLTTDMAETMYAAPGVGLAASQVGDPRRVLVVDPGEKKERGKRLFRMVNPVIAERGDELIDWNETCLSVPDLEVVVQRHKRIRVTWQAPLDGTPCEAWFEGFEAVIVQHELDHLEGTVLLDRVSGFRRRRYLKKVKKGAKLAELAD
jgi:peptide deformylase